MRLSDYLGRFILHYLYSPRFSKTSSRLQRRNVGWSMKVSWFHESLIFYLLTDSEPKGKNIFLNDSLCGAANTNLVFSDGLFFKLNCSGYIDIQYVSCTYNSLSLQQYEKYRSDFIVVIPWIQWYIDIIDIDQSINRDLKYVLQKLIDFSMRWFYNSCLLWFCNKINIHNYDRGIARA